MNLWKIKMIDDEGISIIILVDKNNVNEALSYAKNFAKQKGYLLQGIEQCYIEQDKLARNKPYRKKHC